MKYLILLLLFAVEQSLAVTGPEVVCVNCENFTQRPLPRTGTWYNPEQSGTGMTIDVQIDKIFGVYYGYDAAGHPIWANFSGDLLASEETGKLWTVTAEMIQFANGTCINCEYTGPPSERQSIGTMDLTFNQMGHATFSIDDGTPQNIVPFYFGIPATQVFPEQTSFSIPEIEGWWDVTVQFNDDNLPEFYNKVSLRINISTGFFLESANQYFAGATYYPNPPELTSAGIITCENVDVNGELAPTCMFSVFLFGQENYDFKIPIANITANRIFGETDNGDYIELHRSNFNKCPSRDPSSCINTIFQIPIMPAEN